MLLPKSKNKTVTTTVKQKLFTPKPFITLSDGNTLTHARRLFSGGSTAVLEPSQNSITVLYRILQFSHPPKTPLPDTGYRNNRTVTLE